MKEKLNLIGNSNIFDNIRENGVWNEDEIVYWENLLIKQTNLEKQKLQEFDCLLSYDSECVIPDENFSKDNIEQHNYTEEDTVLSKLFHFLIEKVEFSNEGGNMLNCIEGIDIISETYDGGWNAIYFRYKDLSKLLDLINKAEFDLHL